MKKKRGFTLIEVIIALGIFVVAVIALLSSFTFYYKYVREQRFQVIGENLSQLLLEDVRNIGQPTLVKLLEDRYARFPEGYYCPNYPPPELFIYEGEGGPHNGIVWLSYTRPDITEPIGIGVLPDGSDNIPDWNDPNLPVDKTNELPTGEELEKLKENLASITYEYENGVYVPIEYSSGKRDSTFILDNLTSVPQELITKPEEHLPSSIKIKAREVDGKTLYTLLLEKWTFPLYKKKIEIVNLTPELYGNDAQSANKLCECIVTVYWNSNGVEKKTEIRQVVGFEGITYPTQSP